MSPVAHYFRGFHYGSLVFFGGFVVSFAVAVFPAGDGAPCLLHWMQFLGGLGVPGWLGYTLLFFTAFGLSVAGAELTRWAFRRLVPARCPRCGGDAYGRAMAPITYTCRACGYCHDTGIREGEEA